MSGKLALFLLQLTTKKSFWATLVAILLTIIGFIGFLMLSLIHISPTCVERVFVCEAAVDLFSVMSFLELNQRDFTQYGYISLECCYEGPLHYHLRHHPETKTLYLGQDNDSGGAQSRAACRALLQRQNWTGRVIDKIPCTPAVSYTHLDVYKRQPPYSTVTAIGHTTPTATVLYPPPMRGRPSRSISHSVPNTSRTMKWH